MEEQETYRAGTRIAYRSKTGSLDIRDVCLIRPDETNEDYYVAVSKKTSKVGIGPSIDEAYIDLIIGIICAMKHSIDKEPHTVIEHEATGEKWDEIDTVHRLDTKRQLALISEVYARLNIPQPSPEGDVHLEFDQLGETMHLEPVLDLCDTMYDENISSTL